MKIGPSSPDGVRLDSTPASGAERAAPVRPGSSAEPVPSLVGVERVSLSDQRAAVLGASATLPFNERKVEEVRKAIAEGRFPVDAKAVAERLLADSRDLFGLRPTAR
jgi:negative regulator of flagellin synthesis FlgM